jgi:hypothetical protein
MFSKASNKRSLLGFSGNVAFKKRIAPKIAAHIDRSIDVCLSGEDACLNKWLFDNLSTILPIHITLASGRPSPRRLVKSYRKKGGI